VLILNLNSIVERMSRSRPDQAGTVVAGLLFSRPEPARQDASTQSPEVQA
jgi:hypothetical protein